MSKKIILITGSNSGIGYQTALTLAQQGHHVIIHGRNEQKVQTALKEIKEKSGNNEIDSIVADLSLMAEVKKMAEELKERYDYLDALVNNAGSQMGKDRVVTAEGHEKTMAINLYAPLLLSILLAELLNKSSDGRIVTVSSASYNQGTSDKYLEDIELKSDYTFTRAYGLSKLYVLWAMWHLNKHFQQNNVQVTVNCMEPASALTSLGSEVAEDRTFMMRVVLVLWRPMMKDPAIAGGTNARLAVSDEYHGLTGKFFDSEGKIQKEVRKYYTKENEQIVWDYCMDVFKPYVNIEELSN